MAGINRRTLLTDILPGAVIVTAGIGVVGLTLPRVAQAVPLAAGKTNNAIGLDDLVEKAQPRRRRWVCWWSRSRGRRVCGWRWV
jgi:hypothetical protein